MRIVCPSCDAAYEVPDAMLSGAPRKVRCARCGAEWAPAAITEAPLAFEEPEEPEPPPPPAPPIEPPVVEPPARQEPRLHPLRARHEIAPPPMEPLAHEESRPARGGARAVVAWVLSVLVLVGLGAAAVQWRTQVMAAWPPSQRVYVALGLR